MAGDNSMPANRSRRAWTVSKVKLRRRVWIPAVIFVLASPVLNWQLNHREHRDPEMPAPDTIGERLYESFRRLFR
jgi:hypothetical protein